MTRLTVRVSTRASRNEIQGWSGNALRVRIAAPPVDGKANAAVITLIANALGLPRSSIKIISGASSQTKIIDIDGADPARLRSALRSATP